MEDYISCIKDNYIGEKDCRLCKWYSIKDKKRHENCAGNYRKPNFELTNIPICFDGDYYDPKTLYEMTSSNE